MLRNSVSHSCQARRRRLPLTVAAQKPGRIGCSSLLSLLSPRQIARRLCRSSLHSDEGGLDCCIGSADTRWLNGSFFAAVRVKHMLYAGLIAQLLQLYSLIHVAQLRRSDHSLLRKLALMLEFAYNALNLMFTWFSLANFYIFFVSQSR